MHFQKLGPYRLERQLGRGGMGAVYAGVNEETGQRAAVKVLAPALAVEPNFRGRFATEIETLKKLRHPNIVQLYGFGEENGSLFYAMQLVEGDTLEAELRKGRRFDWREVIAIALDVCKALKHAHDRGVIHRDLKPANLLRGEDGRILLSDFGIAKLFGGAEFTAAGGVIGTAEYMAPEQAAGQNVTPRTDLYSLGAVMFCLLADRPPFVGRSVPDVIHQVRYTEAPLVSRFAPAAPVELETIISRLLEKEPKKRIPTALALSNLLSAMTNTVPPTMLDRAPSPAAEAEDEAFVLTSEATAVGSEELDPAVANRATVLVAPALAPGAESPSAESPSGEASDGAATAIPAPPAAPEGGNAAPPSRFTTVAEEELGRIETSGPVDEGTPGWLAAAGGAAALAVLVAVIWYATRPLSADALFARIDRLVEERDAVAAADEIASFLQRFPDDPRRPEVEALQQEIEVARLERILERRVRAPRVGERAPLVEQTYLEAMDLARRDPARAVEQLEALIAVFGAGPDRDEADQACVALAQKQVERLRAVVQRMHQEHRAALEQRLEAAEALAEQDLSAARTVWRGVVELYGEEPWAAAAVEAARRRLAQTAPEE